MDRTALIRLAAVVGFSASLLVAAPAEARFGKRSAETAEKSSSGDSNKKSKSARASRQRTHEATAVGVEPAPRPHRERHYRRRSPGHSHVVVAPSVSYYGHTHYYDTHYVEPVYVAPAPAPVYVERRDPRDDPFRLRRFELTGSAQPMLNGGILGAHARMDWRTLGLDVRYDYLALLAQDGSLTFDTIKLFDLGGTFALIDSERGRLRGHLGAYMAFAPDAIFVGPGGGLSASVNLIGPLTADAGGQLVLFPFTKVDTWAGAGLRFGAVEGRAGARFTVLDDQGRVDGVRHTDVMVGPFVSLSLVL